MRFHQLDALRFFFAAAIAIGHMAGWENFLPGAGLAVDFFFVLSGFVLTHALVERPMPWRDYAVARFARLYPLHLLTLAAFLAVVLVSGQAGDLNPEKNNDWVLLQNILLIHGLGFTEHVGFNYPSWSVSVEFWVNVLVLYAVVTQRLRWVALFGVAAGYTLILRNPEFEFVYGEFMLIASAGVWRCVAGVLAGYLVYEFFVWAKDRVRLDYRAVSACEAALLGAVFWLMLQTEPAYHRAALALTPLLVLLFAFGAGGVANGLAARPFAYLGQLSYGVYLWHIPVIYAAAGMGWFEPGAMALWPRTLALFAITIGLSILTYRSFEIASKKALIGRYRAAA
ncbi:MAG: acyltransferase [Pseudomonadota bacterium]